ncbi:HpaII family restriction endonuclease [Desulfuribacillus alkaliarsenatis]|uniref:HpaII family restriction endonuclease n=1 Tax=Desulfuribacillus alkaliarsenatis TaxID=766136 RepID=A0A1E5G236_9FIRM|nr:HpaII family restriction endonuclease [Desulfuribacillus alkaliarsenatis]OEF97004.1 hypothetical protein BHF68_05225 [Desulfuribacillus alkaliarsenatis]
MFTGNKGEWSECYTFLKLLGEGRLYAADAELNKIPDIYYPIIKIIRDEACGKKDYIHRENVIVVDGDTNRTVLEISADDCVRKATYIYDRIIKSKGPSFAIPQIEAFLNELKFKKLKAKSADKSDIRIVVYDLNTGMKPTLGFSIKSRLGGLSTLLNAGKTTNFIYKVTGVNIDAKMVEEINSIATKSKIRDRISAIKELGAKIEFIEMASDMFELNLQVIDSLLPSILSNFVLNFYQGRGSSLEELLKIMKEENPFNFDTRFNHNFYEYKLKGFIRDVALGMTPAKCWDGKFDVIRLNLQIRFI